MMFMSSPQDCDATLAILKNNLPQVDSEDAGARMKKIPIEQSECCVSASYMQVLYISWVQLRLMIQ